MREIAALTFVTLDGVMQAPSMPEEDRSGAFEQGGWAAPYWEGVMDQVQREAMAEPYDMLFGRKTYDLFAGHWPTVTNNPVADMMNAASKYVVTSSERKLTWSHTTPISGDLVDRIAGLKAESGPLLQIHGSWELIQFLLAHCLIDEFRLWTFPVVVGSGKRLFEKAAMPEKFNLVKSAPSTNGVLMSIYRRG